MQNGKQNEVVLRIFLECLMVCALRTWLPDRNYNQENLIKDAEQKLANCPIKEIVELITAQLHQHWHYPCTILLTVLSKQFENEIGNAAGWYKITHSEIDELLNSGGSSVVSVVRPLRVSSKPAEKNGKQSEAPSEDYEQEEFDDYEETRKLDTVSYRSDFHA